MKDKDASRKLRVEKAKEGVICSVCNLPILDLTRCDQKWHKGECARIGGRANKLATYHRNKKVKTRNHHGFCSECGVPISSFKPNPHTCGNVVCKNAYARKKAKAEWDALTKEEKQQRRKKKYAVSKRVLEEQKRPKKKVLAKCPFCQEEFMHEFRDGYIGIVKPRVYHDRCAAIIAKRMEGSESIYDIEPAPVVERYAI